MTADDVKRIALQTFDAHPELQTEAGAEELLRRTIGRLSQAGIRAGRQKNPSGLLSKDKLAVTLSDGDHAYDLYGLQTPLTFSFLEVFPANLVPDLGIIDGGAAPAPAMPPAAPAPIDLGTVTAKVDALIASVAQMRDFLDANNERRYKDLTAQNAATVNTIKGLTLTGRIFGVSLTLKVNP